MEYTEKYTENLRDGKEFEDYCYRWLEFEKRTRIEACKDKQTQIQVGENYFGIEFKLDRNFRKTGNLYIELKERSSSRFNYTEAGIYRKDNTFLYAIGDWETLYVFDKKRLQNYHQWSSNPKNHAASQHRQVTTETSIGWLLPVTTVIEKHLTADIWSLYKVSTEQINKSRGFVLPTQRKRRKHTAEQYPELFPDLSPELSKQLTLDC